MIPRLAVLIGLESRSIKFELLAESLEDEIRLLGDLEARRDQIANELPGAFERALVSCGHTARYFPAGTAAL